MRKPWCRVVALNAGLIVVAVYSAAYLLWEPVSGASWSLCVGLPLWMAANYARYEVRSSQWVARFLLPLRSWPSPMGT